MKTSDIAVAACAAIALAALVLGCERRESGGYGLRAAESAAAQEPGAPPCCPPEAVREAEGTGPSRGAQTACPVDDNPVDAGLCTVHEGRRIYFCSVACAAEFGADPDNYAKKLMEWGVELHDASSCEHLDM